MTRLLNSDKCRPECVHDRQVGEVIDGNHRCHDWLHGGGIDFGIREIGIGHPSKVLTWIRVKTVPLPDSY
jgi:hypothetical protein